MRNAVRLGCPIGLVVLVMLVVSGCASHLEETKAPSWERPIAPAAPLRIIDKDTAETMSVHVENLDLPFGDNQNGTELLMAYLANARDHHAAYVSDLYVAMMFKWRGFPIECRSRVYLEDEVKARAAAAPAAPAAATDGAKAYSTQVEEFRPQTIAYRATDMEISCTKHAVIAIVPVDNSLSLVDEFDVIDPHKRVLPLWGKDSQVQYEDVCEKHPVTRDTVRYDYQAKLGFVPVNWPEIAKRYSDERLVEGPPACYRLEQSELVNAHHVLHGRLYYRAGTVDVHLTPNADILEHYRVTGRGAE